jgi:hypothetical protein
MHSHYAIARRSDRIKRMLAALADHGDHTTLELMHLTNDCAAHSTIHEIRQNGFDVRRRTAGRNNGRNINIYRLVTRVSDDLGIV